MAFPLIRASAALVGSMIYFGAAVAAETPLDRSSLGYEDNVTINAACFAARKQGDSAFDRCVRDQIAALKSHPAPDRAAVAPSQMASIERDCDYLRRVGIGQYNDCLRQGIAQIPAGGTDAEEGAGQAILRAAVAAPRKPDAMAPATLPLPREVLPKLSNHVARQALAPAELYKKVAPAVFVVVAAQTAADVKARNFVQGSAVAVAEHLLLTNCHVVKERSFIRILQDKTIAGASLVAADFAADRCLIKSDGPALETVAGVRAFDDLAVGERVFAVGAPRSLERTLSEGLISGLRHDRTKGDLVQTSAPISPGSSGGGLFDDRGNLVGITSFHVLGGQNLDFAIAAVDYWH
ncbi:MAG TPA: serine protease [Stellaceae bacterium]|nr:serine protease [Stellaceae bacterium]